MSKIWNGPPYTSPPMADTAMSLEERIIKAALNQGYAAAMNSPVVTALYDWLRAYVNFLDCGGDVPDTLQAMDVLATYEVWLEEEV